MATLKYWRVQGEGELNFSLLESAKCHNGPLRQSVSTNFVVDNFVAFKT